MAFSSRTGKYCSQSRSSYLMLHQTFSPGICWLLGADDWSETVSVSPQSGSSEEIAIWKLLYL